MVEDQPANAGDIRDKGLIAGLGRTCLRRTWQPTLVFLPGESHGQRSLAGYSPQGRKESDTKSRTQLKDLACTHMFFVIF